MIGSIRVIVEWVRGATSRVVACDGRRIAGVAVFVLLLGLSGYLAAASGVTVELTFDGADRSANEVSPSAAEPTEDGRPAGFVGTTPADSERDADRDGIADWAERDRYGTDPTARDTDGDGIPDGMEIACGDAYPDADPLRQDVYVELDSVEGVALSDASRDQIRAAFADAPVENPSGESGVALHLVESDDALPEADSVNDDRRSGAYNDVEDYRDDHFQYRAAGYYYLLVSTDVAYNGDDHYAGAGRPGTALVEHYDRDGVMSSLVMHELGHAFGLGRGMEGVDTRTYDREGYHSVMNYNILYDTLTYSNGRDSVGRDEWTYVAEDRHRPATQRDGGFCPDVG